MHTSPETIAIMPPSATARCGSPADSGRDDRQDHGRERGIGPEDQDAAGAEQGIGEQRHDRRVQAVDARQARRLGVRDADRHEHRRHDEAGDEVVSEPRPVVRAQHVEGRNPSHPAALAGLRARATEAAALIGWGHQNVQKNVSRTMASSRLPGKFTGSGSLRYRTSSRFGLRRTEGCRYHSPPTIHIVKGDWLLNSQ